MDIFLQQFQGIAWEQIIFTSTRILIVLFLAWFGMFILQKILSQLEQHLLEQGNTTGEPPSESEKRVEPLIRLIRQAVLIVLWVTTILILLKEIGVDVTAVLASAGIIGLAVGFGAQNPVQDFISGFFFIPENQVRVGDVAIINGSGGLVEKINFRTIVLRDLGGIVHIFPNGTVTTLRRTRNLWSR